MKKIFFVLILIFTSILFNLNVYGTSNYIDVGSETLDNVITKNGEIISELDMNDNKVVYAIWDDSSHIYNYIFLKGDNQDLEVGKIKEYVLKIDGDYLLFDNIKIGNLDLVNNEDYKVTEGSTVITFTKKGNF